MICREEDDIIKNCNITADKIHETDVFIYFYRESRRLPRNWQPNEGYMSIDRIEHHCDDCIASIVYSDIDQRKSYSVMKKRKDGERIEEIEYVDDCVVKNGDEVALIFRSGKKIDEATKWGYRVDPSIVLTGSADIR